MIQETHRSKDYISPKITGMTFVAESPHNKYLSTVFIWKDLKVNSISVSKHGEVELLTVGLFVVIPALDNRNSKVSTVFTVQPVAFRRRVNMKKANLNGFSTEQDDLLLLSALPLHRKMMEGSNNRFYAHRPIVCCSPFSPCSFQYGSLASR